MTTRTTYTLFALASAIFSGAGWVLTEVGLRFYGMGSVSMAFIGNLTGGLLLLALTTGPRRKPWPRWPRRTWLLVIAASFAIYALGFQLSFNAIGLIGSGKAVLLARLDVFFVIIMAILFLGEHFSPRHWLAGGFAIGGAILITLKPGALELTFGWGEVLAVLAPLCNASGVIILKLAVDRIDTGQMTAMALLCGALFLSPLLFFDATFSTLILPAVLVTILMGVARGLAWLFYNISMRHLGPARASLIFLSSGFFTILFQVSLASLMPRLGLQPPQNLTSALMGGVLIAIGIVILQTGKAEG